MNLFSRGMVLFLALFASTVCPTMAAAQMVTIADGHMEMGVHMTVDMPLAHHATVASPVPECCVRPMGEHGMQSTDGLTASRVVDGEAGLIATSAVNTFWDTSAHQRIPFLRHDPAPPLDFERRSVMKRE